MKIYIEAKDIPEIFSVDLLDAFEVGVEYINRHGHKGIEAIHVDELEFWKGIIYGAVTELGIRPWHGVELYFPKLTRMCGGESYTYGCFDTECCRFVGNYWGITIIVTEVSCPDREVSMARILLQASI